MSMAEATKFSSTLDEALMAQLSEATAAAGIKPKGPKPKTARTFAYENGFVPFSSVFPVSRVEIDFPVRKFADEEWPEEVRKFIPDIDPTYIFPVEETMAIAVGLYGEGTESTGGDKVLIHGPKGSGKTSLFNQIAARLRVPFIRVNSRLDMESSAIFGGNTYHPEEGMKWVDGPLTELARFGGMFCDDEISRTPAGINAALMGVLERNGIVYLADKNGSSDEKIVKPHKWFRIVATDNTELQGDTTGKYVGTNVQDEAMIDRFNLALRLGYLSPAHEIAIVTGKYPDVDNLSAQRMVQMAAMIREAYDSGSIGFTMSPRGLVEWANKLVVWDDMKKAFKYSFFNKLTLADQKVVAEFFHSIFSENLTR